MLGNQRAGVTVALVGRVSAEVGLHVADALGGLGFRVKGLGFWGLGFWVLGGFGV